MATGDKIVNLDDLKVAYDALNASKLDKDFSSLDTSGGFSLSDTIPVNISGTTYKITGQTLSNAIGGGGGTQQASLTNYVKNCGTISVLPVTLTDSNVTSDMIVIEYTIGDETALGSDWTVTTADGSLTISGTLNKSTTLQLVLSVGYSTAPSILTNLASDSADNVLKASPRPGVTGVLPLTHGGVGSSTASGARTNLSVYSKEEIDETKAREIRFDSDVDTWGEVYNILSVIPISKAAVFSSALEVSSFLTSGGVSSMSMRGIVSHTGSGVFDFVGGSGTGSKLYSWRISGLTSASVTPTIGDVNCYYGATTTAKLKEILGLGTEEQNVRIVSSSNSDQLYGIQAVVANTNNTSRKGHLITLMLANEEIVLWDNTTSQSILTINDKWLHAADTDFTDWNDFVPNDSPSFRVGRTTSGSAAHSPISGYAATWYGVVYGSGVYFTQMAICAYATDSKLLGRVFTRVRNGNNWSIWQPLQMSGCGWQTDGPDLDDLTYPGTYGVSGGSTNKHYPTGVTGGILTVVNPSTSSAYCIQRLEVGSAIYMRYKGSSSGTAFGSWYKYTGTVVN